MSSRAEMNGPAPNGARFVETIREMLLHGLSHPWVEALLSSLRRNLRTGNVTRTRYRRPGGPRRYSHEQLAEVVRLARAGTLQADIVAATGIGRWTVHREIREARVRGEL